MKQCTKRMLAWVLAAALLISCGISGLILPASAATGDVLVSENFEGTETSAIIAGWTTGQEIVDDPLNAGNKVLKINSALSNKSNAAKWGMVADKTYLVSLKAYGGNVVWVRTNPDHTVSDCREKFDTTAGWTEIAYVIKTKASFVDNTDVLRLYAPAGTYIDDVKVTEVAMDEDNLLFGGDFESDPQLAAWTRIIKTGAIEEEQGNHVLHITKSATTVDKNGVYYYDNMGLEGNSTYKLTMRVKGKNLLIYIGTGIATSANGGGWRVVLDNTGSEEWTTFEQVFTTKSSISESRNVLAIGGLDSEITSRLNGQAPDAYVDDIVIEQIPATGISLSQDPLYLAQGQIEPMELIYEPAGSKVDSIEWSSSDETLATVDADGNVTAALDKEGEVTITATAKVDGTPLTASRVITVVGDADTFELAEEAMHLAPGTKQTAVVNATPKGAKIGTLTWSSSDEAVATVDANGVVTAVAAGTATITVKNADNAIFANEVTDTLTVTVAEDGERISGGDFETDTATVVTGGVGTVAVDSADRQNKVLKLGANTALTLNNLTLNANKSYKLTFKARGAVVTTTVAGAVAGDKDDVKTTLSADWTTVTRTFTTGTEAATVTLAGSAALELDNISVVELPEATGITMAPAGTLTVLPDSTSQVGVTAQPSGAFAGDVTYTSGNTEVATVDPVTGAITVVAKSGEAVITATSKNEKGEPMTASLTLKVSEYANVLNNGDFELGTNNWSLYKVSGYDLSEWIVDGVGVDGSKGMALKFVEGQSNVQIFYKSAIPVLPGTTYKVSFDYKATDAKVVNVWSKNLGIGTVYCEASEGEWKTTSKVFTTSANLSLETGWDFAIVINSGADATMVLDNVRIEMYYSGVDAESIAMDRTTIRLVPGRTTGLSVGATPANGDTNGLIWTSSDENVATVEYGVVTGVGKGTAIITAETKKGKKASATVIVSGGEVLITNGTFDVENDTSWTTEGTASVADGVGVKETAAGQINAAAEGETAGKLSQTFAGLKPNTTYTLSVRYAGKGTAGILLTDGTTELVNETAAASTVWTTGTYEFTTSATVSASATVAFTLAGGDGPVYFDYVLLSENATLIDLVVDDIFWMADVDLEQDHQVKPGTKLQFYVVVRNQGEDPVPAGTTFAADITVDGKVVQTCTYTTEEKIASGGTATLESEGTWTATEGDHTISACANSTLTILELDDSNNDYFQIGLHVDDEFIEIPAIAQNAGYTELIFNDEFESLHTIDTLGTGSAGYKWYITRPWANTTLDPDDYEIKDGILTVKNKVSKYNYGMATIDENTGRGFTFNKGYLEFRMRIPSHDDEAEKDGAAAIWSFSPEKIMETGPGSYAKQWIEMDWMEYWGVSDKYPEGHYTVTLHETIRGYADDGVTVDNSNVLANHSLGEYRHKNGLGDSEWHTLAFLWTDDLLVGYLDGVENFRMTYGEGEFSNPMSVNAATEDGTGAFSYMNDQFLALILGGSSVNQLEVDYIRVWSGVSTGYVPPESSTGEGDGIGGSEGDEGSEIIFDMPADNFWNNYCTDDWGDPIMPETLDAYSCEYVLMGTEVWALLSEERQAEIDALLKQNGQPTFEELVEAVSEYLTENPEDMAVVFIDLYLTDENGDLIMEATEANFEQILLSSLVFVGMDYEAKVAVVELMAEYGMPSYDVLLMDALAIAEEAGWLEGVELPDFDDLEIPSAEGTPDTGERASALPALMLVVMIACAVALWATRKRRANG